MYRVGPCSVWHQGFTPLVAPLSGTPGDDKISEEEFALYFSKVMKLETAHAKALFRVADATRDGFLEYREFLGLMATLYRHLL